MTKRAILREIVRMLGEACAELGIENTPLIAWEIHPAAPCYASIYWKGSKQPERLGALSWAELSFGVILRLEEGAT